MYYVTFLFKAVLRINANVKNLFVRFLERRLFSQKVEKGRASQRFVIKIPYMHIPYMFTYVNIRKWLEKG